MAPVDASAQQAASPLAHLAAATVAPAAAPGPLRVSDLLNAPIPAYCQHKAGRLVNGSLPLTVSQGYATVLQGGNSHRFAVAPRLVDITGDHKVELIGVLECSAGGVSWPDLLLAYSPGPKLIGALPLGNVVKAEHSDVTGMSVSKGTLNVSWRSYEGCCFFQKTWTGQLRIVKGKLVLRNVKQRSGPIGQQISRTSVIGPDGVGPLRLGMTLAQARNAAEPLLSYTAPGGGFCHSLGDSGIWAALPVGSRPQVVRIDVYAGQFYSTIGTAKHIRIGSAEREVLAAYPKAAHIAQGAYGQAYYRVDHGKNSLVIYMASGRVTSLATMLESVLTQEEICA